MRTRLWVFAIAALALAGTGVEAAPAPLPRPQFLPMVPPGWLGIAMSTTSNEGGVKVEHVIRTSPAEKAGVKENDRITRVDGTTVLSATDVTRIVSKHTAGEAVSLTLMRDGKEVTVHGTVTARPSGEDIARMEHVGAFAPAFSKLTPVNGSPPLTVSSLRGKVALLEFWATWCGPCRLTAPVLGSLQAKYGAMGLTVVGITSDDPTAAADHARKTSMGFSAAAEDGSTSKAYGVYSLPTLFVIDKGGVVREVAIGYDPGQDARIEKLVQTLLAEPTPGP